ncbi:MAG: hypothetical protein Q8R40_01995 [bacterium]|nr:hypothetical protein [bacterium]
MNKNLIIVIAVVIVLVIGGGIYFSQSDSVKIEKALTASDEQDIEVPEEEVIENSAEEYRDDKDESSTATPAPTTMQKKSPAPTPVKVSPTPTPAKGAVSVDKAISEAAKDDASEPEEPDVSEDGSASYQD